MKDAIKSQFEAFADRYQREVEAAFREGYRVGLADSFNAEDQAWVSYAKTKEQHGEQEQTQPESNF